MVEITKLQASFAAGEISPRLTGRIDVDKYSSSCSSLINYLVSPFGSVYHRPGFKYIAALSDMTKTAKLVPFEYSNTQAYILEFTDTSLRFYRNQGIILDSRTTGNPIYSISTPYALAELSALRFAQSFDTMYITHNNHPPYKLVRQDNDLWTLTAVDFNEPAWLDQNSSTVTFTPSATTGAGVTITASSATFASSDVGRSIRYCSGARDTSSIHFPGTGTQVYFDIPFFPATSSTVSVNFVESTGARTAKTYTASASPGAGLFTIIGTQIKTGDTATTSQQVEIKQANSGNGVWGWATITGYTSSTVVTVTVKSDFNGTATSTYWRLGAWSATTGYPQLCCFHEQRLLFAKTTSNPNGLWGSGTGDFENFSPDNASKQGQIDADTGFYFPLVTPSIQWIKGLKVLLVGCSDGIIQVLGTNGAITATSVETKKDSALNCDFNEVAATDNEVIFIERLGRKLYTVKYQFQSDGFVTTDLSKLSEHMGLQSSFTNIAYAPVPSRNIWVLRTDGTLRSCTYVPDDGLVGWASHKIGGTDVVIESIAAVAGQTYSELWAVVKRTINGSTKRYVECLQKEFFGDSISTALFSDCNFTYNGSPTSTVSGLSALEGQTVQVIADGSTHPDCVVTSGSISLNSTYSIVNVGLYSPAILQTQLIEGGGANGSNQGASAAITKCVVRFFETVGGTIAADSNDIAEQIPFRTPSVDMNSAVQPFTGNKILMFPHGFDDGYQVLLTQPYALPSTVLMLLYKATVNTL